MNRLIDSIRRVRTTFRAPAEPDGDPGPALDLAGKKVLLVYLFDALGDAVLLGPVAKALLEGGAKAVGVVATKNAARVLKLLDQPVRVHALPEALALPPEDPARPESRKAWRAPEVREAEADFTAKLAAKKYDVAVDLTHRANVDGRRWLDASGAEVTLGWVAEGADPRGDGLTWGAPDVRYMADRHWSRLQMLPLRGLGVSRPDYDVGLAPPERAQDKAAELFGAGPRVLLVPGARDPNKRWAPERFERIGAWVTKEAQGSVVIAGAPSEAKLVRALCKTIGPGATPYTGKDIATLVALTQEAHAVVTNDTGPMHFAFLSNTPTVAIFTWMSPVCWGPPRTDPRFVVLRVPEDAAAQADGTYTRAAIHYLDGLLGRFGPCAR